LAAFMVTIQVPVPEQAPLQPVKVYGEVGVAVSVTTVFSEKPKKQVEPQTMPAGELVTVPIPLPVLFTVKAGK